MSDRVTLMGAEDVARAGHQIQAAANEMQRAASNIEDSLYRHRMFMDDWLNRIQTVLEAAKKS